MDVVYQEEPPITPIPYHERMLFDYRRFLAQDLQPRFEFGFGLSYTRFEYSDCKIEQYSAPSQSQLVPDEDQDCSVGSALHQTIYQVTCLIKNVGQVSGTEVGLQRSKLISGPELTLRAHRSLSFMYAYPATHVECFAGLNTCLWTRAKLKWCASLCRLTPCRSGTNVKSGGFDQREESKWKSESPVRISSCARTCKTS